MFNSEIQVSRTFTFAIYMNGRHFNYDFDHDSWFSVKYPLKLPNSHKKHVRQIEDKFMNIF